jgi:hypothetical protein
VAVPVRYPGLKTHPCGLLESRTGILEKPRFSAGLSLFFSAPAFPYI